MRYFLTRWAAGRHREINLSVADFESLARAQALLYATLEVEEKFELVLENYKEFESHLLQLTVNSMLHEDVFSVGKGDRLTLTRRIANLFSSVRLYTDQVKHAVSQNYGAGIRGAFDRALSFEYDNCLGYRVCEALRNHMQHHSNPINGISYSYKRHGGAGEWIQCSIDLSLDVALLGSDREFKSSVLTELQRLDPKAVDLLLFVRKYVEGVVRVHESLREHTKQEVSEQDAVYRYALAKWMDAGEVDVTGLAVLSQPVGEEFPSLEFHVVHDVIERRLEMEKANRIAPRLASHFVSSASKSTQL